MDDEKKFNYVTKKDFLNEAMVIWMFIMLTLIAIIWDDQDQVFLFILFSVSFLMFVGHLVFARRAKAT